MAKFLLSVHVLAAILAIGPITVAASLFPRYVKEPAAEGADAGTAAFLHRICRGYALVGLAVPAFGFATAAQLGVLTDAWLIASIVLTAVAAGILAVAILPAQQRLLKAPGAGGAVSRLTGLTGVFNLLWVIVVVLMIVRPGSTTSA
ncbi:hypothetical protein E1281_03845 [Actinomadura sp. KC345]|uniref:hypothetical protein n=1 Tax=Actinomadura sp. KC345 TaxID=2530371 RepID=UPI00104F0ADC|nr:hypothetical protein [Actinomadura sp. KC345]TDC57685.1 hypothetical protein E1281_03845 [Actinomadura sp. KC345]